MKRTAINRIDKYKAKINSEIIKKRYDDTKKIAVEPQKIYFAKAEQLELKVKSIINEEPVILQMYYIAFAEELVKKTTEAEREIIYNKWFARGLKHLKLRKIGNALFNLRLNTTSTGRKQDPVLYSAMSEGTGTETKDNSGYGNNGAITGASWTEGIIGKGLSFNGINNFVDCGNDASLNFGTGDFSVGLWFKTTQAVANIALLSKINHVDDVGYSLWIENSAYAGFYAYDGANEAWVTVTKLTSDGEWHHLVGVREGNTFKIFLDGSFENEVVVSMGSLDNGDELRIGHYYGLNYFNGSIDEVRLFKRALSSEEIKNMYESERL